MVIRSIATYVLCPLTITKSFCCLLIGAEAAENLHNFIYLPPPCQTASRLSCHSLLLKIGSLQGNLRAHSAQDCGKRPSKMNTDFMIPSADIRVSGRVSRLSLAGRSLHEAQLFQLILQWRFLCSPLSHDFFHASATRYVPV